MPGSASVTRGTTTILWRTSALTADTSGISRMQFSEKYTLENNFMDPTVTKVVFIVRGSAKVIEVVGYRCLPAGQCPGVNWLELFVRNTDNDARASILLHHSESMKMAVQPSHCILNGNMQTPETVCLRNLDSPPD